MFFYPLTLYADFALNDFQGTCLEYIAHCGWMLSFSALAELLHEQHDGVS